MMFPWVFPWDKDPLGGQGAAAGWGPQLTCTREHTTAWEGSRDASTCRMRKAAVSPQPEPFPNHHQPLLGRAPTWYFGGLPCRADPRLYPSWGHYSTCRWQRALRTHSALPRARRAGTGRFLPAETPRPPGTPTPPTPPRPAPGDIGKKDKNRVRCHLWAAGDWRGAKGRDGPRGHPKEHWRCVPQVWTRDPVPGQGASCSWWLQLDQNPFLSTRTGARWGWQREQHLLLAAPPSSGKAGHRGGPQSPEDAQAQCCPPASEQAP